MTETISILPSQDEKHLVQSDIVEDAKIQENEDKAHWEKVKAQADEDEEFQHGLTLWQAIKVYKKAIGWSIVAATCVVMDGYDTLILGSSYAVPAFQKKFGVPYKKGYQIPAAWQAGCSQAANVGSVFGCFIAAFIVDKIGYRKTLILALLFLIPFIGMAAFAPNLPVLLVAELFCGIPWATFSTLGPAYASEICPLSVRAYLTTYINLCWVFGHFIGASVLLGTHKLSGTWGYRIPFVLQWAWPIPLITAIYFAPESPWWLIRHDRLEEAEVSIRRLASSKMRDRSGDTLAQMVRTNKLEEDVSEGTTFFDLFKGSDLRRTEITCVIWTAQVLTGLGWSGNSTYFFEQAGIPTNYAFTFTMVNYALGGIGTLLSWVLMTHFGRRPIVIYGLFGLGSGMLLIGILGVIVDQGHTAARYGEAVVLLTWYASLQLTLGSLAYCVIGETSSTRLRNKTVGLGRVSYNIFAIGFGIMTPYMINPTAWNWGGKAGFFWAPLNYICATWAFFRLPEMKGRSYYELDILFERRIPARKFKSTEIERNADDHTRAMLGISPHAGGH